MTLHPESEYAIKRSKESAAPGKRIVFVSGTFNIVHPGHLRLFRFAAENGDFLVVGVLCDRLASNAQLDQDIRLEGVAAINWVGHAFILHDAPSDFVLALKPSVVVKGNEHENSNNPELPVVRSYGGQLLFGSGDTTFSSLQLLRQEAEFINHASIVRSKEFMDRHGFTIDNLITLIRNFRRLKICVIGDTIVDEYVQCDPLGMSQEDPTIVVTPILTERFIGGAAIVAAHARSLGAHAVEFFSAIGEDDVAGYVSEKLAGYGVKANLVKDGSRPTTLKQRFRAGNKTLLRVSHLRQHKISKEVQQRILSGVLNVLDDVDLVIFSDFNYGVLPQELVDPITAECRRKGIMIVADSQSSSQVGDVSRFKYATLLTPTEREARIALGNYEDGLVVLAEALRQTADAENVVITLGAEGILIHAKDEQLGHWVTDRLAALNTAPKDSAGAGDSLLVSSSMAMALGGPIWQCLYLGSLAAACQVGRTGNVPLRPDDLLIELNKGAFGVA